MKKKYSNTTFYIVSLIIFLIILYVIQHLAHLNFEDAHRVVTPHSSKSAYSIFISSVLNVLHAPICTFLMQLVTILIAVRIFGLICNIIGQPTVVGEIIAGIVLGPSLIGYFFPEFSSFLFPVESLRYIEILSQIGLILFMFIVGLELNFNEIKKKANEAILISHSSIILPFALGFVLAYFMYNDFVEDKIPFISFALFMGISMSITAFPVLARIVQERGMTKSSLGKIVITCAAIDDITAWCVLATVITIVKSNSYSGSIFVIIISICYIVLMFKCVKPLLKKMTDRLSSKKMMSRSMLILYFIVLFISAYTTELIGIHALFGAFLAGVIMPTSYNFREKLTMKMEDITLIIFLPLFFVYTGLKTQIGLIDDAEAWIYCVIIILVAVLGKFLGGALAARYVGLNWKSSSIIGLLMNTRGLMELVVLNIGLELGVLSPKIFSMMVLMAIVTTFMTSPLLNLVEKIFKVDKIIANKTNLNILIACDDLAIGIRNVQLFSNLFKRKSSPIDITLLYVSEGSHFYEHDNQDETTLLESLKNEISILGCNLTVVDKVANNFSKCVVKYANNESFNFILINDGKKEERGSIGRFYHRCLQKMINFPIQLVSNFGQNKKFLSNVSTSFDQRARTIITQTDSSVGVLIDKKHLPNVRKIITIILDEDDTFIGSFLEKISENTNYQLMVCDSINLSKESIDLSTSLKNIQNNSPYHYQEWNNNIYLDVDVIKQYDLILVSIKGWIKIEKEINTLKEEKPTILVLTY